MQTFLKELLEQWPGYAAPLVAFFAVLAAGWFASKFLFRRLASWTAKTESKFDDLVVESLRRPFSLWVLILALYISTQTATLPPKVTKVIDTGLLTLWIVSLTVVASKLAGLLVRHYGNRLGPALPMTTLSQGLASMAVGLAGALILLDTLNISVTPILTALGVGGLAVALALQDTLSNLFAGFYVSLAGQVRVGDYVKIDSGSEGYVTDISWRSTTLRALPNNLIVIPNAKLAQAIVTNYHLPEKRMSLLIPVSVSYECDPEVVERTLLEVAVEGTKEIPGLLAEPGPAVRFIPGFGASSLDFTLICQVAEFVDQYLVQHELRKRIFRRFKADRIEIPFPIRTVYLKQEAGE
jgi:small-conductance mechanosensitive channel